MSLIEWNETLVLGISVIDNQHQKLISLINILYEEIEKETITVYSVKKAIDELFKYAAIHFITEEAYFKKFGYKETAEHIEEHKYFLKSAENLRASYKPGKVDIAVDILNFAVDWYLEHIKKTDRKYAQFFIDNGLK